MLTLRIVKIVFTKYIKLSAQKKKAVFSLLTVFLSLSFLFFGASPAQAQTGRLSFWSDPFSETNVAFDAMRGIGLGNRDPRAIAAGVVEVLLGFLGVLAIILMLYAGVLWMTSQGEVAKIEKAKKIMRNAVIGLLIILASFGVALYVMRALMGITGGELGTNTISSSGNGSTSGLSGLGSGIIKNVYPAPNQRDVPRNTAIMVTFKEEIDPKTLCDKVEAGKCAPGAKILKENIIITALGQVVSVAKPLLLGAETPKSTNEVIADVYIKSNDNLTFVLNPAAVLGSPDGNIWHSVALSSKIKKADGKAAFSVRGFDWSFEVSNKIDLIPPKVVFAQIFPPADSSQDTVGAITQAKAASAILTIKSQPNIAQANKFTYNLIGNSVGLNADNTNNNCNGEIDIVINNAIPLTASVKYLKMSGRVDNNAQPIIDRKLTTACGFDISFEGDLVSGMAWSIILTAKKEADFILLNGERYYFVNNKTELNQILVGNDINETAKNIASVLANNPTITTSVNANKITLIAKTPGLISNGLFVDSSYKDIVIDPFAGGVDQKQTMDIKDLPDQPKNTIVQINFNESIDPTTISGSSESLKDVIRVLNNGKELKGRFVVSNQYKTVEFIPSEQCGTNGCGEPVYCLPSNANIKVELVAASLASTCTANADCVKYAPYDTCSKGFCVQTADNSIYPAGVPFSGITDLANNSLDGNANNKAEGPVSFYDLNLKTAGSGDNFSWSFWTSAGLDITPPKITALVPDNGAKAIGVDEPLTATFSKLMMANSLNSGQTVIIVDNQKVYHNLVSLRGKDNSALGYWVEKNNIDANNPADGQADYTVAIIQHESLGSSFVYRPQIGSGVKDIYQNCFKPCASSGCQADAANASCCLGKPSTVGSGANCP